MKIVFTLLVILSNLVLLGCGGDGEDSAVPPAYDLTGFWRTVDPVECTSSGLTRLQLEALEALEAELLGDLPSEVIQTGNRLEITDVETGHRVSGTISGDQVHFEFSEGDALLDIDAYGEGNGTVLSDRRIMITQRTEITTGGVGTVIWCSYHMVKT